MSRGGLGDGDGELSESREMGELGIAYDDEDGAKVVGRERGLDAQLVARPLKTSAGKLGGTRDTAITELRK